MIHHQYEFCIITESAFKIERAEGPWVIFIVPSYEGESVNRSHMEVKQLQWK
jgi:hypothetical protein